LATCPDVSEPTDPHDIWLYTLKWGLFLATRSAIVGNRGYTRNIAPNNSSSRVGPPPNMCRTQQSLQQVKLNIRGVIVHSVEAGCDVASFHDAS
jgi:hypothetical protein